MISHVSLRPIQPLRTAHLTHHSLVNMLISSGIREPHCFKSNADWSVASHSAAMMTMMALVKSGSLDR